ncbi:MAG: feruloyl-CoA synthase [Burkholderiaceae bacterium]
MSDFFENPEMLAPARTLRSELGDGSVVLRSPEALRPYARCVGRWLEQWAEDTPDALAFAQRDASGAWRRLSWRELRWAVGAIAQSLLALDLPAAKPVVILSDNAIDHALLMLAAMHVGRAVCSVSSAYCRLTQDYTKIAGILRTLDPALVYAADAKVYGPALRACAVDAVTVLGEGAASVSGAIGWDSLLAATEGPEVMRAFNAIQADDHAKYLLTSGSTGQPKVVINTHRMLCANQQMIAQTWRFLDREKPVLLDWLPWSHTFGGNHNLNLVLRNGGTMYIDEGRPAPGLIDKTVRNLREVRPNLHFNVPRGLDMLLPFFESDADLAHDVFTQLRMVFYAGAALPPAIWKRLVAVAARARTARPQADDLRRPPPEGVESSGKATLTQEPLWLTTSWGSTETSPAVTSAHWRLDAAGCIGIPLPGLELKLVRSAHKHELRVRGVSVFPGYRNAPDLTAAAFDDEGFYRIGDAGYLADELRPERGVMFDGRIAEDFKLTTGTWVSVGMLRLKLVSAFSPYAQDVVVTGHDRHEIGALVFPSPAGSQLSADALAAKIGAALSGLRAQGGGSSQTPLRALILSEAPNADAGEITDKGYVNQGAVLARRAGEVELLYSEPAHPRVIQAV